jgi:2-hydroxy-3-oxopropionate reductase
MSTVAPGKNVAFLGVGNMGKAMAGNLVKNGFTVTGFDINQNILDTCPEHGITAADTVKEAIKDADFVITALPKDDHIEHIMFNPDGVMENSKAGACVIDVSTVSPMLSK